MNVIVAYTHDKNIILALDTRYILLTRRYRVNIILSRHDNDILRYIVYTERYGQSLDNTRRNSILPWKHEVRVNARIQGNTQICTLESVYVSCVATRRITPTPVLGVLADSFETRCVALFLRACRSPDVIFASRAIRRGEGSDDNRRTWRKSRARCRRDKTWREFTKWNWENVYEIIVRRRTTVTLDGVLNRRFRVISHSKVKCAVCSTCFALTRWIPRILVRCRNIEVTTS